MKRIILPLFGLCSLALVACDDSPPPATKPAAKEALPATATFATQKSNARDRVKVLSDNISAMIQELEAERLEVFLAQHANLPSMDASARQQFVQKTAGALKQSDKPKMLLLVLRSVANRTPVVNDDRTVATFALEGPALQASPSEQLQFRWHDERWLLCNEPCAD